MRLKQSAKVLLPAILTIAISACDSNGDDVLLSNLITVADEGFTRLEVENFGSEVLSTGEVSALILSAFSDESAAGVALDGATWVSSNPNIATVNSAGVVTAGVLDGEADITATFGGLSVTESFRVSSAPLSSINIIGPQSVNECGAIQLSAQGIFLGEEDDPRQNIDVIWTAVDTDASFDTEINGLFRAGAGGNVVVNATTADGGVVASQSIEVADNLAAISIVAEAGELAFGSSLQYQAIGQYNATGIPDATITDNVIWSIEDAAATDFAVVDNGLVTPSRAGDGTLMAACAGIVSQLPIQSTGGDITQITIDRDSPLFIDFVGSERTENLEANAFAGSNFVANVTEDSEWSVVSVTGSISLSNDDGSRGELTINGEGEIVISVTFTDDDDNIFISPNLEIIVQ